MKLVVLYGPPAVGKLTVARELSKITNYKILHNHLAIDLVESIFDRSNPKFWELIDTYRVQLAEEAAKGKLEGVILTSVNIKGNDDKFIKELKSNVERHSGDVHFVRLSCDIAKLKDRLSDPSRSKFGKLTDAKVFDDFVSKYQVFEPIDFVDSLTIDTTEVPPEKTAQMIKEHYKL